MMERKKEFDIDFNVELPKDTFFPVYLLAKLWHCSIQHVINLIESGELKVPVNLKGKVASKAMIRVPRPCVVEFLNRRKVRQ